MSRREFGASHGSNPVTDFLGFWIFRRQRISLHRLVYVIVEIALSFDMPRQALAVTLGPAGS